MVLRNLTFLDYRQVEMTNEGLEIKKHGFPEKIFIGKTHTLFVVTANVGMKTATFETVVRNLVSICLTSASHLFEHIRYLELYANQLKINLADQNSDPSDDIASAMLVIWEVDRVMSQNQWEKLTSYVERYSSTFF